MNRINQHFKFLIYLIVLIGYSFAHAGSYESFFSGIKRDHRNTVEALLQRGFDPNTVDENGQPGLIFALRIESFEAAQALIDSTKLDLELTNRSHETALMLASLRGQVALVEQLLKRGAVINRNGWNALHYAATAPDDAVLRLLLERGAAINATSPNGTTALMLAAQYGPTACVDALLAKGALVDLRNDLGLSATDFATRGGREKLAQSLTRSKPNAR
jgi:uncharacterized protein